VKVSFHYDIEKFRLRDSRIIKKTVNRIVTDARLKPGILDIIITSDEKLYEPVMTPLFLLNDAIF